MKIETNGNLINYKCVSTSSYTNLVFFFFFFSGITRKEIWYEERNFTL